MDFRHELKHEISLLDIPALRSRLSAVMGADPYAPEGRYIISSLYFDTPGDRALKEKLNGVSRREKFRLRYYNGDISLILLEKKVKIDGLCAKQRTDISLGDALALARGERPCFDGDSPPLLGELRRKMAVEGLRPKVIVQYTREPFIYSPGNVRVTIDYHIRTCTAWERFLEPGCPAIPVPNGTAVLEVKWDSFLPSIVRDLVQTPGARAGAFSKYAACRIYG